MRVSRFVRPETATLTLANGDMLTVKKRLTSGEQRAAYARMYLAGVDGALKVNPLATGVALITAYLIDWQLAEDSPPIRGLSMDELTAVIDNLSFEDFTEIKEAIERHEVAMTAEREAAKNGRAGLTASAAISPSPSTADGALSGSVT